MAEEVHTEENYADKRRVLPSQLGRLREKMSEEEKAAQIDYIDNKVFLERVVSYRQRVIQAEQDHYPIPPVPDEIGELFLTLAKNLSNRPCFIKYPYKEDMVLDGVENCLRCINNYRIGKDAPKNTFSYFTQVVYWAFLRRIKKEKKSLYTKFKVTEDTIIMEDPIVTQHLTYSSTYMLEFIEGFERSNSEKAKAKKERKKTRQEDLEAEILDLEHDLPEEEL